MFKYRMNAIGSFSSVVRNRFEIIQSLFYIEAFGVSLGRHFTGARHIYYIPDCSSFHLGGLLDRFMFKRVISSTSALIVPSRYVMESLKERYRLQSEMIPPGVDTSYFTPGAWKDLDRPRILCMAELGVKRKRVSLLVKAFDEFRRHEPGAVLQLSGRVDPPMARSLLEFASPRTRDFIEILGVGKEDDIPSLYANAAMTVLPSVKEAFGMVLTESLAAGTPVVGTRDGGIPEIVDDPRIGVLFEGTEDESAEALCDAMLKCMKLARDPATSGLCRRHSMRYDWSKVGRRLEHVYERVLKGS
jgi:glycosyltransferase involved in cell wall biosynthesis